MIYTSTIEQRGAVCFPKFAGERIYMLAFTQQDGLPSRALCGRYAGPVGDGGDCTHLDLSALSNVPLSAGYAYAGNVTMLHESLPVAQDCLRTLVRLNVPGWEPRA